MPSHHTSADDWRVAADLLGSVALAESVGEFTEIALRGIRILFRADLVVWTTHDRLSRPVGFRMDPDLSNRLGPLWEPLQQHFHEHPMSSPATFANCVAREQPFMLGDHLPMRRHFRSALFNEVYVHIFAKHQLALVGRIHANLNWTCACNRLVGEYGPRDRELARYLKLQLNRIVQALARRQRAETIAGAMGDFFSQPTTAWALVEAGGRVSSISESARVLLAAVPGANATPEQLPPACSELAAAVRNLCSQDPGDAAPVVATIQVTSTISAVALRLIKARAAFVIFQKSAQRTATPRLTRREAEILGWLGEGKSNVEIGVLLAISSRTVEKHCGNLFAKIGVETRFAAALFARATSAK